MERSLNDNLTAIHEVLNEEVPSDTQTQINAAWLIVASLLKEPEAVGQRLCRQLLADYLRLPLPRPSNLHSAILGAAVKVARIFPEFRFIPFVAMWDLHNLRPEDYKHKLIDADHHEMIPPLVERVAKACTLARLLRPDDVMPPDHHAAMNRLLEAYGFLPVKHMIVTRIQETTNKEGRKFTFVTLSSPDGFEIERISHDLRPHPLRPLPEGRRHFVNVGQVYDVALRMKKTPDGTSASADKGAYASAATPGATDLAPSLLYTENAPGDQPNASTPPDDGIAASSLTFLAAYLSPLPAQAYFPTAVGYIEHIDTQHKHMHVYDGSSRHLVASVLRFSREREGQLVRFVPIIPAKSTFKRAIITGTALTQEAAAEGLVREIRITAINREKGYASWSLTDPSRPITERLSPLQLSKGETSPIFTQGYLSFSKLPAGAPAIVERALLAAQPLQAIVFLQRGSDKTKRPVVARILGH